MKTYAQVCTLEQGKILKRLGVNKPSLLLWLDYSQNPHGPKVVYYDTMLFESDRSYIYPAYTVAELGAMIKGGTKAAEAHWQWLLDCVNSGLSATVAYNPVALAGHIITSLQNNILTADACNAQLLKMKTA